ncbi:Src substrate cortactin-like [Oopsacas minuta]|uniref:Src substrate cortactin-like n=1 Tax=Oopsacas minuta TaxID=111878 RepID=A0AAV7JF09_9METZ|nr:Src substrate cortactin-like [Oopsacas minuta]
MDRSAVGHDYQSDLSAHSSQTDHSKGFGGRYGVEKDRMDRSAGSFSDMMDVKSVPKPEVRTKPKGAKSGLFAKFEQMSVDQDSTTQQGANEAKERRRLQEAEEAARQREINATLPVDDDTEETSVDEPKIVRPLPSKFIQMATPPKMADMQPQEPEEPIRRPLPIVPVSVPVQIMEPEPIPDSEVLYDTSEDAYEVRIQTYFLKYSHLNS